MTGKPEGSEILGRDGHRLVQLGALLFLLGLLVGLAVPRFAVPRLALSTHLLGIMQGTFAMVIGLVWPRLRLTRSWSRIGRNLAAYGCLAAFTANLLGASWGAGRSMLPMAAGDARGTAFQEGAIRVLLVSAALSLVSVAVLVLWGLRGTAAALMVLLSGAGSAGDEVSAPQVQEPRDSIATVPIAFKIK